MTSYSQLTPICYQHCDGSVDRQAWSRYVRRSLHIVLFVTLAWLAFGSAPLSAQQSEREAREMVSSIAGTIYNLAWPTARYEAFSFGQLRRMNNGWDVPIVLYGRSAFSGDLLWLELVLELRDGSLHDIRLGRNNAILAPPFATSPTTADVTAAVVVEQRMQQQRRQALHDRLNTELLIGTWRDENSVVTFTADRRLRVDFSHGSTVNGSWTVHNNTLSFQYDGSAEIHVSLEHLDADEYRTKGLGETTHTARRVLVSSADSARQASAFVRIGKGYIALTQTDSALRFFGRAELLRRPERIDSIEHLLQTSPLNHPSRPLTAPQRQAYVQRARAILANVVPEDVLPSIPTGSAEEIEDALAMLLPSRMLNILVTSAPPGLPVQYRVIRSNPAYRPGPYSPITTDTTFIHERAKLQLCYLDQRGQSRMIEVHCRNDCTVRLPWPVQWTLPCAEYRR